MNSRLVNGKMVGKRRLDAVALKFRLKARLRVMQKFS
jgi:hypothetical protein